VAGAGRFGAEHMRVLAACDDVELAGIYDIDAARAATAAAKHGCPALSSLEDLASCADAAVVATPTSAHAEIGSALLRAGLDVLVEKPIAADLASAAQLVSVAAEQQRILQVGHLERFNPAVQALREIVRLPLFFEVHRLSVFSARSLDVDVVLDLMIHDIDIVLWLTGHKPEEIRAAGLSILSPKVDIANVRLAFPGGCVANLTASRVSTDRVRKLRLFQPHEYISLDYSRRNGAIFTVDEQKRISFRTLEAGNEEPLSLQDRDFLECVRTRRPPLAGGTEAYASLEVAVAILDKIKEHARIVSRSMAEA
jgi:predicted dehydrogenase